MTRRATKQCIDVHGTTKPHYILDQVKQIEALACRLAYKRIGWDLVITSRVRRSRGEMYIGHGRLYVCLSLAAFQSHTTAHSRTHLGNGRGCPLVVHYWADLQSVHGFRCYDNIATNAKCQRVLVCLVF